MKRCPECRRDYYDDSLLYCLDDGTRLLEGPGATVEGETALLGIQRADLYPETLAATLNTQPTTSAVDDLYFQGRFYAGRDNQIDNEKAIQLFEQAVEVDPDHALSHIELARAYGARAFYFDCDTKDLMAKSYATLQRAFRIGSHLAEAHEVEGFLLWNPTNGFPHEQAIAAYRNALALDPSLVDAHHWLAAVYFHIGLFDEAQVEIRVTLRLDPGKNLARLHRAMVHGYAGRYKKAIEELRSLPRDLNPPLVAGTTSWCLLSLKRIDAASDLIERSLLKYPDDIGGQFSGLRAVILANRGAVSDAEAAIAEAVDNGNGFGHFHHTTHYIAAAYALMGRPDDAVEYLRMTADNGFPCYPLFDNDPNLDPIRSDAGFKEFMSEQKTIWEGRVTEYGLVGDRDPAARSGLEI